MVTYSLEDDVMDKEREDAEKLMLKEVRVAVSDVYVHV